MNLSGHSLVTTFDAPPVSGGALASVFHLQIDRTHAATLRAVQSERFPRTVGACLTVFEREIAPELSRFAASVLAQTREIEDLRGDRYAGNESRSELYWRDTHARDGYPRALLVRDRGTGQLFQAPNTIGESEHFEVVGFAVLERGAPRFARLGDARAYFSAPEFAEKVAARLARKQQQELRGGLRPVKRNARVVSMPDNADGSVGRCTMSDGTTNDTVQIRPEVVSELQGWIRQHDGPSITSEAAENVVRSALREHLERSPPSPPFDMFRFCAIEAGDDDLEFGAVRMSDGPGRCAWLICVLDPHWLAAEAEAKRAGMQNDTARDASAQPRRAAPIPRHAVATGSMLANHDRHQSVSLADEVHVERPSLPSSKEDQPFTLARCVVAGTWASIVAAVGLASIDGFGGLLVFVVFLGLPWLLFTIHDRNVSRKPLDVFEACGVLLGGAFLSGFCALPFAVLFVLVKWMAG